MDDINGVHIELCHIGQNFFVICQHLGIFKHFIFIPHDLRNNMGAFFLIDAAVNCQKKALCQIGPGAEHLHLLTDCHG